MDGWDSTEAASAGTIMDRTGDSCVHVSTYESPRGRAELRSTCILNKSLYNAVFVFVCDVLRSRTTSSNRALQREVETLVNNRKSSIFLALVTY